MSPLDPRLPLADTYYFIANDYMLGKGRINPRVMGIGLAGALLGELVLRRNVEVQDGHIYVVSRDVPDDALQHGVLDQLLTQSQHRELSVWVAFLAETAHARVVERLTNHRRVHEVKQRRLIGTRRVVMPTDTNEAAWQSVRLERLLNTSTPMQQADCVLSGLLQATGLMSHVLWDPQVSGVGQTFLPQVMAATHPSLSAIVRQVEAAVGQSVLAPR